MENIWNWLAENWYWMVIGIYEFVVRVAPTSKTYSILTIVMKVIAVVFPNRQKPDADFKEEIELSSLKSDTAPAKK